MQKVLKNTCSFMEQYKTTCKYLVIHLFQATSKQTHILQENDETNDMTHHFQLSPILMTAERYSLAVIKVGDG